MTERPGSPARDLTFADSPLEGSGFEPSVPRDATKVSTPLDSPPTERQHEREPRPWRCRGPCAVLMVRIRLAPAESHANFRSSDAQPGLQEPGSCPDPNGRSRSGWAAPARPHSTGRQGWGTDFCLEAGPKPR